MDDMSCEHGAAALLLDPIAPDTGLTTQRVALRTCLRLSEPHIDSLPVSRSDILPVRSRVHGITRSPQTFRRGPPAHHKLPEAMLRQEPTCMVQFSADAAVLGIPACRGLPGNEPLVHPVPKSSKHNPKPALITRLHLHMTKPVCVVSCGVVSWLATGPCLVLTRFCFFFSYLFHPAASSFSFSAVVSSPPPSITSPPLTAPPRAACPGRAVGVGIWTCYLNGGIFALFILVCCSYTSLDDPMTGCMP
ncbi:hypothetical protein BD289DRAFT_18280 [Coniella lustricola]|uniref:Uncharacterized protein n=1 Tax=Coniella lustricola TaxID=2025994 RepID=A0A2T3AJB2_9PEZI|nr:hypothetical protein BD289DRAFT_18280 [Coniella lustricola]